MSIRMNTSQVRAVGDRLIAAGALTERSMSQVVTASARALAQRAKDNAPERSGDLKRSIRPHVYFGLSAAVVADIRYAFFVEYGTSFTPAQPFMGPAVEEESPEFFRSAAEAAYEVLRYL